VKVLVGVLVNVGIAVAVGGRPLSWNVTIKPKDRLAELHDHCVK